MRILNTLTATIFAFTLYLVWCIFDVFINPTQSKLIHIEVYENPGRVIYSNFVNDQTSKEETTIPVPLSPRSTIVGAFEVNRLYTASNYIERLIAIGDIEYLLFSTKRQHIADSKNIVLAEFEIPQALPDRCGYSTVSKNYITKRYNIISYLKPSLNIPTSIHFCVKR